MNSLMSRRLTPREVAATLGITLGELTKLRFKGSRQHDSTLPLQVGGFFIEAEILAWKKSKEIAAAPSPSAVTPTYDRRNGVADRRRRAP